MKVGVIGAGPAGLSCAYELVKEGVGVDVFEAAGAVGSSQGHSLYGTRRSTWGHTAISVETRV